MTTTTQATGLPMDYCPTGSLLNQTERDWNAFADEDRRKAQRSDRNRIQAQRRREIHASCCAKCGGGLHG